MRMYVVLVSDHFFNHICSGWTFSRDEGSYGISKTRGKINKYTSFVLCVSSSLYVARIVCQIIFNTP